MNQVYTQLSLWLFISDMFRLQKPSCVWIQNHTYVLQCHECCGRHGIV